MLLESLEKSWNFFEILKFLWKFINGGGRHHPIPVVTWWWWYSWWWWCTETSSKLNPKCVDCGAHEWRDVFHLWINEATRSLLTHFRFLENVLDTILRCSPWILRSGLDEVAVCIIAVGHRTDQTDPCPVKTKRYRSLCLVKISSVGAPIIHQHSDSVAMRDREKDFSLWMHRTSLTSDRDKFDKRAGRWLVFWPTRNDGGEWSVSQLERSVVKLKFRSPVSTEQLLFSFHRMCALAGYHAYVSAFVRFGTKTSTKGQGAAHYRPATSMTRIDEPTSWLRSHGKPDLQRRRIDVHVTYLQVCAGMTLYARLPTLHAGRSPKSSAPPCRILKTDHPDQGPGALFFFFFFFFGSLMKFGLWPIKLLLGLWPIKFGLWPIMRPITFRRL